MTAATTAKPTTEEIHVVESLAGLNVRVDRERGIIPGVKVVGFEAKNGRYYPPETLRSAVRLYEGAKVNIDHPPVSDPMRPRGVADRFGTLKSARFVEGSGIHADLHFNPKHHLAEQVAWDAENQPSAVGFSHNAMVKHGRRENGRLNIAEVISVKSVDLVADPATTKGVFESIQDPEPVEEQEMDFSKLTLADLKTKRPDLVTALEGEQTSAQESEQLQEQLKAALEKVSAMEVEAATTKLVATIQQELEAVGFDPTNKHADKRRHVSDAFLDVLRAQESVDARKALIDDRKSLVGEWEQTSPKQGQKPVTTPVTEGQQISSEDWLKRIRRRA